MFVVASSKSCNRKPLPHGSRQRLHYQRVFSDRVEIHPKASQSTSKTAKAAADQGGYSQTNVNPSYENYKRDMDLQLKNSGKHFVAPRVEETHNLQKNETERISQEYKEKLPQEYRNFASAIGSFIPSDRIICDPLRTFAYGTDASFYRLNPKIVVELFDEQEVVRILKIANDMKIPVTFRAAGTSLSGQAITDSVLLKLVPSQWSNFRVSPHGEEIKLQPGIIGGQANKFLGKYDKKIGPDPATINSAFIGGIAANNSSGMCCGVSKNCYHTVQDMRLVLANGAVLDTESAESREEFKKNHPEIIRGLQKLGDQVKDNAQLREKITHKYKIKNTTGYALNSLVDYHDPIDILKHLVIGSEGTLAFISNITLKTVPEYKNKASALVLFPDVTAASRAVTALKSEKLPVDAVELMDRASLRAVENTGIARSDLGDRVSALLIDTRAESGSELENNIQVITKRLSQIELVEPISFTQDPDHIDKLWAVRKGLYPAVGAMRKKGTIVIIEDVAVPIDRLEQMVIDLQDLFKKYKYDDALVLGHALEGNLHVIFSQDLEKQEYIDIYHKVMDEMCDMVATKHGGSLKAEHGTGRNIAPYVELEWGKDLYEVMWQLKEILDPNFILSPGVLLNRDKQVIVKDLKAMPTAHELIDHCVECGMCESQCPSRELTLTPRQRIVLWREMERLRNSDPTSQTLKDLELLSKEFDYEGNKTCAADGMCATTCPVSINTGELIKYQRAQNANKSQRAQKLADAIAARFDSSVELGRAVLYMANLGHRILGTNLMYTVSNGITNLGKRILDLDVPKWNSSLPKASQNLLVNEKSRFDPTPRDSQVPSVVYFPSCMARIMGPSQSDGDKDSLHRVVITLLEKAGVNVIWPKNVQSGCCGLAFQSKGFPAQAEIKLSEMEQTLWHASDGGRIPILCDTSPCTLQFRNNLKDRFFAKSILDPIQFSQKYLIPNLEFPEDRKISEEVLVHATCSSKKLGVGPKALTQLVQNCCQKEVADSGVSCCGMAGDLGLTVPELPQSALKGLVSANPKFRDGYSTSRSCEIGLSLHSGVDFRNIFYLLDATSVPKSKTEQEQ
eukprot:TRINITY_DN1943_c0_g1_i3.p1 TRINITY_DN1943_c0_g1~~TRINITY_DN1943_c0_g1_i3.p1  ORF type:complete len:1079 (+),score=340.32 TRINITY_DN1943_c0_g1_i3:52-3288(+)